MSDSLYAGLGWLPQPPVDFKQRCRSLTEEPGEMGRELRGLSTHALDLNQLIRLAGAIGRLGDQTRAGKSLTPFKLGVLGNGTLDMIVPALIASAPRHGILLECVTVEYGTYVQAALSPRSAINAAGCDAVLIALDYRALPLKPGVVDATAAQANVAEAIEFLTTLTGGIKRHSGAPCILQTLAPPVETLFGSLDRQIPGTARALVEAFNRALPACLTSGDMVLDIAHLAETVGLADWHSPAQWNLAKLPFSDFYVPLYAEHVTRLLGAMRGKSRRCLILDLDNTLWGGVVGDDGLAGIAISEGDAVGEAYRSVQQFALALRERGIVLAVSSKNDDAVARRVFKEHPEMLIRETHIAVFQANWNDKAANIKAISDELSLGLDAMVFLDDNPAERGLVRSLLPEVAAPELPEDPALYARTLAAAGYFETIAFSEEDRQRAAFYESNMRRVALQQSAGDVDAYLASLKMEITFKPFDETGRSRIAQLVNKSNQFNLTTRRYTEAELAALEARSECFTLQVRLSDMLGDNGMISVVICKPLDPAAWEIDTWLMSCRVLGRRVEQMVLSEIVYQARDRGIERLVGVYRPTERNAMVRDHYSKLGFSPLSTDAGTGSTTWEFGVSQSVEIPPMSVRRETVSGLPV